MTVLNIVLAILLFLSAIFLIVAVLLQSGKSKGVSGAITGGSSETFFGKNKGKSFDKKLSLITTIVAIVFVVLALVAFVTQDYIDEGDYWESIFGNSSTTTTSKKPTSTTTDSSTNSSDSSTTDSSTTDSSTTDSSTTDSSTTDSNTTDSEADNGGNTQDPENPDNSND